MTILIEVVNDNRPTLLLGGDTPEYTAVFMEGQEYLGGPVPVPVALPVIQDADSGENTLTAARVEISQGINNSTITCSLIKCTIITLYT